MNRECFTEFAESLSAVGVYRAKGFMRLNDGVYLLNFVAGRWELERFEQEATELVFIGKQIRDRQVEILNHLKTCEQ